MKYCSAECGDNYMAKPLPYQEEIEYTRALDDQVGKMITKFVVFKAICKIWFIHNILQNCLYSQHLTNFCFQDGNSFWRPSLLQFQNVTFYLQMEKCGKSKQWYFYVQMEGSEVLERCTLLDLSWPAVCLGLASGDVRARRSFFERLWFLGGAPGYQPG